jgi:hypothetical protein
MASDIQKTAAQLEAETQDEIAKIMSEIDTLQSSMAEAPAAAQPVPTEAHDEPLAVEAVAEADPGITMQDFRGGSDEPSMEETLGSEIEEPAAGGLLAEATVPATEASAPVEAPAPVEGEARVPVAAKQEEATVTEFKPKAVPVAEPEPRGESQSGTLTLSLTGSMNLRLRYECEGQEVTIGFVDGALRVELADGTEFKVPVRRKGAGRAAA